MKSFRIFRYGNSKIALTLRWACVLGLLGCGSKAPTGTVPIPAPVLPVTTVTRDPPPAIPLD